MSSLHKTKQECTRNQYRLWCAVVKPFHPQLEISSSNIRYRENYMSTTNRRYSTPSRFNWNCIDSERRLRNQTKKNELEKK